jgi:(E)-4-hydroxy-3-methylbut-2-enyl-diphosphate synthase
MCVALFLVCGCRDGTVFSAVSLADLKQPEALYRKLGAKLVVGMPFKDIATSDSIFMRQVGVFNVI